MTDLQGKLRANHHRRKREEFIRDASPALSTILESADYIAGLDAESWVREIPWPSFEDGRQTTTVGDLPGSTFSDWDDWQQVCDVLTAIGPTPDVDAHLFLNNDGPIWHVSLAEYPNLISEILAFSDSHHRSELAWVSTNRDHGIVMSSYCGYLPEDRRTTLTEVVYEILHWGIQGGDEQSPRRSI